MNRIILITLLSQLLLITCINAQNKQHPRLFFQQDEIKSLQAYRTSSHTDEWASLVEKSKRLKSEVSFEKNSPRILRGETENLMAMALVQLLEPDQPYKAYIRKSILQFVNWEEWDQWIAGKAKGPNDLALGQALIATSGAYDISHNLFTSQEQKEIDQRLIAIADHFHHEYGRFSTERFDIMHCNHGINAYAALTAVLYTVDNISPAIKTKWEKTLSHKYETLTGAMNNYMSDGASDEGATYFMFQLKTYMQWFEMIRNHQFKTKSQPYSDLDWFKNTSTYCLYTILPGGKDNFGGLARFADCNPNFWGDPRCVFPALAKALDDPIAKWLANDLQCDGVEEWRDQSKDTVERGNSNFKGDVWRYIWKAPNVQSADITQYPNWHFFEDLGIFAWRSSWANDATYFTCRSGQHYQGHGQPDDGQFMLHKAGVPYISDLGYSNPKTTKEHNVLLVNGKGQIGEGQDWPNFGSFPNNKDNWGETKFLLTNNNTDKLSTPYFDVVLNPTNLYDSTCLKEWQREIINLGDFYILKDVIKTEKEAELELLLHSSVTEPGNEGAYEYVNTRDQNPFHVVNNNTWKLTPSTEPCEPLYIYDLTADQWNSSIEESWFYDNYVRKKKGNGFTQQGYHLSRKTNGAIGNSIVVMGFENSVKDLSFHSTPNGVVIRRNSQEVGNITWKTSNTMSGYYSHSKGESYILRNSTKIDSDDFSLHANEKISGIITLMKNKSELNLKVAQPVNIKIQDWNYPVPQSMSGNTCKTSRSGNTLNITITQAGDYKLR
ncbi:DUF4962 domain-containing protein [Puteibacter caeruleilacunae]|nr:DUF4962 domain-containing protein [Puteibacter caeruleilacunae]